MTKIAALGLILFLTLPASAQSKPQKLKVLCSGSDKSRTLWQSPDATETVGQVKCRQKVTVIGPPVIRNLDSLGLGFTLTFIPVTTKDKRTGYLPSDALEAKKNHASRWPAVMQGIAQGMQAYARGADPHIAWCDNHGGYLDRAYESETVNVTLTDGQTGTGTIQHRYVACKDGTRFKEE